MDFFGPPEDFDDAFAIALYPTVNTNLGERELYIARDLVLTYQNPDAVTTYIDQTDFDRRLIGFIMTITDPHMVNACLPFWQAVQPRNGANASERAASLGVDIVEYNKVEDRFNLYFGASTFLANDLSAVWSDAGAWED